MISVGGDPCNSTQPYLTVPEAGIGKDTDDDEAGEQADTANELPGGALGDLEVPSVAGDASGVVSTLVWTTPSALSTTALFATSLASPTAPGLSARALAAAVPGRGAWPMMKPPDCKTEQSFRAIERLLNVSSRGLFGPEPTLSARWAEQATRVCWNSGGQAWTVKRR